MYPPKFDYYRASSVDEALSLLQQHGANAKVLAGGHSLIPMMKMRLAQPGVLIDIGRIDELKGIRVEGDTLSIGPLTTHAAIAASEDVQRLATALSDAASVVGDLQVRNRGTIGGNLAHADPASDLPAAVLALGGEIEARGPAGSRTIAADDFFQGLFTTALDENEIITAIRVPTGQGTRVSAYVKFPHPASGYAVVGVAAVLDIAGNKVTTARVAANGAFECAKRLAGVEQALSGADATAEAAASAAEHATDGFSADDFMSDIFASADYRAHLLKVYTRRALQKALERA